MASLFNSPDDPYDFIKKNEGFRPGAYWDTKQWSIGYGRKARDRYETTTREAEDGRIASDAAPYYGPLDQAFPNLEPHRRKALGSFTYNLGPGWITDGSNLQTAVREGDWARAARIMREYNKVGGQFNQAVYDRRLREGEMLLGNAPATSGSPPPSSSPPTLASTLTGRPQPMPYDEYTPPDVIARQQRFGDQMRSMDPGTGKLSGLAAALGALGGVYGNYKADSYSRGNQRMQQDVYKNAMGAPDAEGVARALIGSGVPDAQKSGLALLLQERDPNKQLERQMKQLQIDELKRNMAESDLLFGGGRPAPSPGPAAVPPPAAPPGATPPAAQPAPTAPVQAPGVSLADKIAQLPPDKQLALRKAYREKSPKFYEMLDEFLDPGKKAREAGEAARAKEVAEAQGKAIANLPVAIQGAERMIKQIDEVLNDKNLKNVTGPIQGALPTIRGKSVATEERIKQIQGSVFLRAFETLKGGGTITEVEGAKAEQALARLKNLRQDDKEYVKALEEARQEVKELIDLAKDKTLGLTPQATTARAQAREAIRKGADRNAVIERLKQNSVDTSGL